jgi:hypothetical protein
LNFSAKVIASPSRVNAGIQPQVKRKNLPLRWVSVFFLFSLARLFLPPLDAEKIIPEVANRPNRGK